MFWGSLNIFMGLNIIQYVHMAIVKYIVYGLCIEYGYRKETSFRLIQYKGMGCAIIMQPNGLPVHSGKVHNLHL
jgi:hypothetical protein